MHDEGEPRGARHRARARTAASSRAWSIIRARSLTRMTPAAQTQRSSPRGRSTSAATSSRSTTTSPTACARSCASRSSSTQPPSGSPSSCPRAPRSTPSASCPRRTSRGSRSTRGSSSPTCSPTRAPASTSSTRCRSRRPEALALLDDFQRDGSVDLGPVRVDREGDIGHVTTQNHAFLNSEDDADRGRARDRRRPRPARRRDPGGRPPRRARDAPQVRRPADLRLGHEPDAPLPRQDLARRVHARARPRPVVSKMYRGHDLGAFDERARAAPREAVDRRRRQLRDRRRLPVAARDGPRHRRDRLVLQPAGAQGGDHPRLSPTCACRGSSASALARQAHLLRPRLPRRQPRGADARRRGRAGGRDRRGGASARLRS